MNKFKFRIISLLSVFILIFAFPFVASAEEISTVNLTGHYVHPVTGVIEDSGGQSSIALGQSMVDSITSPTGLLQEGKEKYLSFKMSLMNSMKDVDFKVQNNGDSSWNDTTFTQTESGDDYVVFRVQIPSDNAIVRVQSYVVPMGRSVVYYVSMSNKASGNNTDFPLIAQEDEPAKAEPTPTPTPESKVESKAPETTVSSNSVSSETVSSKESNTSTSSTEQNNGLIIGRNDGTNNNNSSTSSNDKTNKDENEVTHKVVFDDSFWWIIFLLFFCANLLSGGILMFVYILIKKKKETHTHTNNVVTTNNNEDDDNEEEDSLLDLADWGENNEEQ